MTDVRYKDIKSEYLREIQPILNEMEKILMFSTPSIIINESGIKRVYDDETQNKIDILNKHIKLIANNYKSQHPELFKFIQQTKKPMARTGNILPEDSAAVRLSM